MDVILSEARRSEASAAMRRSLAKSKDLMRNREDPSTSFLLPRMSDHAGRKNFAQGDKFN
jgi:hypothetical protein